jgi:hypothetical protein
LKKIFVSFARHSAPLVTSALLASLSLLSKSAAAQVVPPPPLGQPAPPPGSDSTFGTPPPVSPTPGLPPGADGASPTTGTPGTPGTAMGTGMPTKPKTTTEAMLDAAEEKDTGRSLEIFYTRAEAGFSFMNMASFDAQNLGIKQTKAAGPAFGLGAGFRLFVLSLGARLRLNQLSSFNMWQLNGVLDLHVPIQNIDISFGLHGGYSFVGKLSASALSDVAAQNPSDRVSITGLNAGLGFNVDYYVSSLFSIGGGVTGEGLFLKRPPVAVPTGLIPAGAPPEVVERVKATPEYQTYKDLYEQSGTMAGFGVMVGLRVGLHLGI